MIFFQRLMMMAILPVALSGCNLPWHKPEVRYVDPALPMSLSRRELVDYLNSQNKGLRGWRCNTTKMTVRLPNGLDARLSGSIACQSPQHFRLIADNVIAQADLGSNAERCWVYVKPGAAGVMTWTHADGPLLQQVQLGVPYIDPGWLMLVLGVKPLAAEDYVLGQGPADSRDLWLTAVERGPQGRTLRRVIKVDTINGVVREHAIYDSEKNVLVRAQLSNHKPYGGHTIPGKVKLLFPQMDSEIVLSFTKIETNPVLPSGLWKVPGGRGMEHVDIGAVVRRKLRQEGRLPLQTSEQGSVAPIPFARLQPPLFGENGHAPDGRPNLLGMPSESAPERRRTAELPLLEELPMEEPDWDTPDSEPDPSHIHGAGFEQSAHEKARNRAWPPFKLWPFGR